MSTFQWQGDSYPIPPSFQGLSMDDWFLAIERVNDRVMKADELDLPQMLDADGDELDAEEVVLIREFGFSSGDHFEAFRNWGSYGWASQCGENPADLMMRMAMKSRQQIMSEQQSAMRTPGGTGGGGLDPVEGGSLEQWAAVQAGVASGGDATALCAQAGIDGAKWQRVSDEWNARMASDTTATIATAYGNAFASAGTGQFGSAAANAVAGQAREAPVSFERWVQIQEAMNAAHGRRGDANAVLAEFGMTAADFGNLGAYWNRAMQAEMTKYHQLYSQCSAKYRAMYGGA